VLHRDPGVVATGPGEDGDLSPRFLEGELDDAALLLGPHGGALAGGAAGHEDVDGTVDLAADEAPQRGLVEVPGRREGRDQRDPRAGERASWHGRLLPRS